MFMVVEYKFIKFFGREERERVRKKRGDYKRKRINRYAFFIILCVELLLQFFCYKIFFDFYK